jgi:peroxiredoxin (alkyl hydroperoxide reductase subunit C)
MECHHLEVKETTMLSVGDKLPEFDVKIQNGTSVPAKGFERITDKSYAGKWMVFFFWPKDFTFVCPTEIMAFNALNDDFTNRNAVLLGGSTDTDFVHLAWRQSREDLADVKFPWIADNKKELTSALGILDKEEAVALRATFIIDPDNIIRFVSVNDLSVGRNPNEVLRVLDALQTEGLCPCNWQQGEDTLAA